MDYQQPFKGIHLLLQPAKRNQTNLEFTYTSGGSWFEQPGDLGRRHLLEHCLISRTKTLLFNEVKDFCFEQNIDLNAYTSNITMSIVALGHKDDFQKIFDLLLEFFLDPTFSQEDLDREKEVVLREISERKGDSEYILYYDTINQIFTPESLNVNEILGNIEEVALTTIEDLERIHKQILRDSNLILKFSGGGFDPLEVKKNINSKVESLQIEEAEDIKNFSKKYPIGFLPKNKFKNFKYLPYIHPLGHEHAEVTIFIPCKVSFKNRPIQAIFEQLYLKYGGILYDRLRDDLGLVYGISGYFRQTMQSLEIELACETRYIHKILEEVTNTFGDFNKYYKPNKFEQMKDKIRKQKDIATDDPKFFVDFTEKFMLNYGETENYENYNKKIGLVTQNDISNLYQEIQQNLPNKRVLVVSKNSQIQTLI